MNKKIILNIRRHFAIGLPSETPKCEISVYIDRLSRFYSGEITIGDVFADFISESDAEKFIKLIQVSWNAESEQPVGLELDSEFSTFIQRHPNGLRFKEFLELCLTPFSVKLGSSSFHFSFVYGRAMENDLGWSVLPFLTSELVQYNGEVPISSGVTIILGPSNSGKTPLMLDLVGNDPDGEIVRVNEPHVGYLVDTGNAVAQLVTVLASDLSLCGFDSVKNLLSEGGALMSGGISRSSMTDLSNLSVVASLMGKTIFVPLNPGVNNDDIYDNLVENAKSNVSGVIWHTAGNSWKYLTRTGEAGARLEGTFSFGLGAQTSVEVSDNTRIHYGRISTAVENRDPSLADAVVVASIINKNLTSDFDQE